MKILFLNPIGSMGGAERCLLDFIAELRRLEPAWELCLISGTPGPLLDEATALGVHAEVLPMPDALAEAGESSGVLRSHLPFAVFLGNAHRLILAWLCARRYAAALRKRCLELRPDALHSNGIKFHLLTHMMRPLGIPAIWHIHDFLSSRRLLRRALRWAAPAAKLALANSEATARDARSVLGNIPIKTLLNAVDTVRFSPLAVDGRVLDELAGLPPVAPETLRIGLVATYARWKGQDLFLRAAAHMNRKSLRFYIVGSPIYKTQGSQFSRAELEGLARSLGLSGRVGFVPFQNAPEHVYRALDIVVHASTKAEPFGRTIAEAMSCGRPVIASFEGGVPELFKDGRDAIGFQPRDATALAAAMERLASNDTLRAQLGMNARQAALERFALARLGAELVAVFRGILPQPPSSPA
jgi:glycosyltransferase involved in cell wall biosynthesis